MKKIVKSEDLDELLKFRTKLLSLRGAAINRRVKDAK